MTLEQQLAIINSYLERFSSATQEEISTKLILAEDRVATLLSSTKNRRQIQKELNVIFKDTFATFETVLIDDDIPTLQAMAWDATALAMTKYIEEPPIKFKDISKATKEKLASNANLIQGYTLQEHFKHLEYTTVRNIKGIIFKGFSDGLGVEEINREIRTTIGNINRNQSKTLVRTALLDAVGRSQEEFYDTISDEIDYYVYSSVLDNRTTPYCMVANGYKVKDKATAKYKPRTHYNCRSFWLPENEATRQVEQQQKLVQFDKKTVNHRDGTKSTKFKVDSVKNIPENVTGIEALKYYDDAYLQDYLGKTRYNLYKSGKAKFADMYNLARGELIPVEQLRKKVGI